MLKVYQTFSGDRVKTIFAGRTRYGNAADAAQHKKEAEAVVANKIAKIEKHLGRSLTSKELMAGVSHERGDEVKMVRFWSSKNHEAPNALKMLYADLQKHEDSLAEKADPEGYRIRQHIKKIEEQIQQEQTLAERHNSVEYRETLDKLADFKTALMFDQHATQAELKNAENLIEYFEKGATPVECLSILNDSKASYKARVQAVLAPKIEATQAELSRLQTTIPEENSND
jgi:hypothetical protein